MSQSFEVNFDGLVGPTHNYSGLSHGNVASTSHRALRSNPLEAVLQGLKKMKTLADDGFKQGVIAPQERPHLQTLRRLGFSGSDSKILEQVAKKHPSLLSAVSSASSMWTANAATVSPSADTRDRKVHLTPANLCSKFHRSIEAQTTALILKKIFKDQKYFVHHEPLEAVAALGDEGAANHSRLCQEYHKAGLEFFVYGRKNFAGDKNLEPKKYPARQTLEACETLSRTHLLHDSGVIYAQQLPEAIDAGVFHNDVVGVGNQDFYFCHEQAYVGQKHVMAQLKSQFAKRCGGVLKITEVPENEVSLADAVKSYLFNSQILTIKPGQMILIAPQESQENQSVARYLEKLVTDTRQPIRQVRFFDLRQSMRNGGGPACLRLRVALKEHELKAVNPKVLMNENLYLTLETWAKKHYRDRLNVQDLGDSSLLKESRGALDELTKILGLGSIYEFQK